MSTPLPDRIGPYQILRLLGRGGTAQVYQARKEVEGIGLVVALKVPRQHVVMDERAREQFLKEARITARMGSHAIITHVLDVGVDAGLPYMAMEYVTGVDLGQLSEAMADRGVRWSEPAIAWVLASIIQGLRHAYGAEVDGQPLRIVHRDISPSNILLTHEGYVKVTDFGISRMVGLTASAAIRGKARYIPGEQLQGRATSASDMYAVGAIGWELIEGKRFRHDKTTRDEMLLAAFSGERPAIERTDVSLPLREFVYALLDPNEHARVREPDAAWAQLKAHPGVNLIDPDPVRDLLKDFFGQRRRSGHSSVEVRVHPELAATREALAAAAGRGDAVEGLGGGGARGAGVERTVIETPLAAPPGAGLAVAAPKVVQPSSAESVGAGSSGRAVAPTVTGFDAGPRVVPPTLTGPQSGNGAVPSTPTGRASTSGSPPQGMADPLHASTRPGPRRTNWLLLAGLALLGMLAGVLTFGLLLDG